MPIREVTLVESYWPADTSEGLLNVTLGDLLRQCAADVPDRVALIDGVPDAGARRRWTYAELLEEAERIARAMLGRFAPGEAVAVFAANSADWVLLQQATEPRRAPAGAAQPGLQGWTRSR